MRLRIQLGGLLEASEVAEEIKAIAGLAKVLAYSYHFENVTDKTYVINSLEIDLIRDNYPYWYVREDEKARVDKIYLVEMRFTSPGLQEFETTERVARGLFELIRDVVFFSRGKKVHELELREREEKIKLLAAERLDKVVGSLKAAEVPLEHIQKIVLGGAKDLTLLDRVGGTNGIKAIHLSQDKLVFESEYTE